MLHPATNVHLVFPVPQRRFCLPLEMTGAETGDSAAKNGNSSTVASVQGSKTARERQAKPRPARQKPIKEKPAKEKASKEKKCKKEKDCPMPRFCCRKMKGKPTLAQIGDSVQNNFCSCCGLLGNYVSELIRFFTSCACGAPADDTQFQEMVCDLLSILGCMCRDCALLVRALLRLLF